MPTSCLFCDIVAKKIPAYVVGEDEHAIAFLDIHPRAQGHTLVIPRAHASTIIDLPEGEVGPLFSFVRRMAVTLVEKLGAEGLTIGINHGKVSGQEVEHLHVHMVPRFRNDGGGSMQNIVNNPNSASLEETVEKITH